MSYQPHGRFVSYLPIRPVQFAAPRRHPCLMRTQSLPCSSVGSEKSSGGAEGFLGESSISQEDDVSWSSTGFPPSAPRSKPSGKPTCRQPREFATESMRRAAPLGGPAFANLRRKGPRRVREACDMELYLMEGLSISSVIMWLLGVPLSLILLLRVVGIGR